MDHRRGVKGNELRGDEAADNGDPEGRSSYPVPVPNAIGTALKIASHQKWSVVQARKRFPNQADREALSQFRCLIRFFKQIAPWADRIMSTLGRKADRNVRRPNLTSIRRSSRFASEQRTKWLRNARVKARAL